MNGDPDLTLIHLGWSGFRLDFPNGRKIYIDPPAGAPLPLDRDTTVLITHAHPEHLAGTLEHVRNPARQAHVQVAAPAAVCRFLRKRSSRPGDSFTACTGPQQITVSGFEIDVFTWRHMPLLPPGLKPALHHIRRLASRPLLAWRTIAAGLRGPLPFPMLGYRIVAPEGLRVLVYGEGLHRLTDRTDTRRIGAELPADILLVAVEPEDIDVIPDLIRDIGAPTVVLYEAHRGWREAFGLPCADLEALASLLAKEGRHALVCRSGAAIPVVGVSGARKPL